MKKKMKKEKQIRKNNSKEGETGTGD